MYEGAGRFYVGARGSLAGIVICDDSPVPNPQALAAPAGVQGAARPWKKQVGAHLCVRPE